MDLFIDRFILGYRSDHPGADKTTITPALAAACFIEGIKPVSKSTVGRIIRDLENKVRLPYGSKISIREGTGTLLVKEANKPRKGEMRRKDKQGLRASRAWRLGPDGYGVYALC